MFFLDARGAPGGYSCGCRGAHEDCDAMSMAADFSAQTLGALLDKAGSKQVFRGAVGDSADPVLAL